MSFASEVKNELIKIENRDVCCDRAELCGMVCFGGSTYINEGQRCFKVTSENAAAVRRCFGLIKKLFSVSSGVSTEKSKLGRGRFSYSLVLAEPETVTRVLDGLSLLEGDDAKFSLDPAIVEQDCCRRAFVRGAFLGGGSMCAPEKEYHMEFVTHYAMIVKDFTEIFESFGLMPKTVLRKSKYMIYFKGGDEIEDALNVIGAHRALMEFMNVRILKETRNNVNRKVNCETANMDKALNAAFAQIQAIEKLKKTNKFESLTPALRELAELRVQNPEVTLAELGAMMTPPLTKSGVNHRIKRIMEAADV
ncbi:MAG: DNA-binding protein WhiA [Clostridia bacterium]|nr:DNA-binding protein WhiA [Clostridia bacterium]